MPFGLYTGVTLTVLCLFFGAAYLTLKTDGALHDRVGRLSGRLGWIAAVVTLGWLTWSHVGLSSGLRPQPDRRPGPRRGRRPPPGWPRPSSRVGVRRRRVGHRQRVGSIFFDLFPRVMVSTTSSAYNLTVGNSASPSYTLRVMTVVTSIFFPVVLAYQGWSLYVFRKRITSGPVPAGTAGPNGPTGGPESTAVGDPHTA